MTNSFLCSIYEAIDAMVDIRSFANFTENKIRPFSEIPCLSYDEELNYDYDYDDYTLFYDDKHPQKDKEGDIHYRLIQGKCTFPEHHAIISYYENISTYYKVRVRTSKDWGEDFYPIVYLELVPSLSDEYDSIYLYNGKIWNSEDDMYFYMN